MIQVVMGKIKILESVNKLVFDNLNSRMLGV